MERGNSHFVAIGIENHERKRPSLKQKAAILLGLIAISGLSFATLNYYLDAEFDFQMNHGAATIDWGIGSEDSYGFAYVGEFTVVPTSGSASASVCTVAAQETGTELSCNYLNFQRGIGLTPGTSSWTEQNEPTETPFEN